jgi:hypothetical protein
MVCRRTCQAELKKVVQLTTQRMRLLTICSTAANARRLYDKSVIEQLQICTQQINETRRAVINALILAARNTRLRRTPVRSPLVGCARLTTGNVAYAC